ncbi:MBL fold metallo-hydrolase [Natroniella sulfidigena]|uniref:MBL fold metallo-hydrolase n=1 Tax=Natroniella sulfidigena TaxID=723921 RepID=UPI00200A42EE|nr:MBL fold metallo-hydrolase [Natroniella sulfidigena]MCK8816076.1 MBL fold metallo-hydrolase [Natroniella sulfidigena]
MKITFLGTATSRGVPVLNCDCPTCTSQDPRNRRYRSSIYLESEELSILIDTPPELRLQLLKNKIKKIDTILFTHAHADHIMGFDDIRAINYLQQSSIPCYGNKQALQEIRKAFSYIFTANQQKGGLPQARLHHKSSPFELGNMKITPLVVKHGNIDILGYRINDFAYITDCSFIPEETFKLLEGVQLLILGTLRYRPHPTHFNLEESLEVIERLNVPQAYLTHLSHKFEHNNLKDKLPDHVLPAYDGLTIKF